MVKIWPLFEISMKIDDNFNNMCGSVIGPEHKSAIYLWYFSDDMIVY